MLELLIQVAQKAGDEIEDHILKQLSNTMVHCVKAVIQAEGWFTEY